jgi:hypothetical protein
MVEKLASDSWQWARNWGKNIETMGPSGERRSAVLFKTLTERNPSSSGTRRMYSEGGYLSDFEQKVK